VDVRKIVLRRAPLFNAGNISLKRSSPSLPALLLLPYAIPLVCSPLRGALFDEGSVELEQMERAERVAYFPLVKAN